MTSPPGMAAASNRTPVPGRATNPMSSDVSPDVAAVIAALAARGKRIKPERAARMVAAHLAAADRRADSSDPALAYVLDYWDETGETAVRNIEKQRNAA